MPDGLDPSITMALSRPVLEVGLLVLKSFVELVGSPETFQIIIK